MSLCCLHAAADGACLRVVHATWRLLSEIWLTSTRALPPRVRSRMAVSWPGAATAMCVQHGRRIGRKRARETCAPKPRVYLGVSVCELLPSYAHHGRFACVSCRSSFVAGLESRTTPAAAGTEQADLDRSVLSLAWHPRERLMAMVCPAPSSGVPAVQLRFLVHFVSPVTGETCL